MSMSDLQVAFAAPSGQMPFLRWRSAQNQSLQRPISMLETKRGFQTLFDNQEVLWFERAGAFKVMVLSKMNPDIHPIYGGDSNGLIFDLFRDYNISLMYSVC